MFGALLRECGCNLVYAGSVLTGFQCSYCGEWNETEIDPSAGREQSFVEDCQVCCQPNLLTVRFLRQEQRFVILAERES